MRNLWTYLLVGLMLIALGGQCVGGGMTEGKSMRKALLLSALLPGAGQHYLGNHARARTMYVAEAGVWTAFTLFRVQGGMREDRYQEIARIYAGVEGERSDDYYKILSFYPTSEDYNVDVMREARLLYPDDRERQLAHFEANGYFGPDAWAWTDLSMQDEFEWTRTKSKESYRRSVLTTGFAVLNRLVSVIDVYLTFRLDSRQESRIPTLRVESREEPGFNVFLSTSF
jgi:hypothetical protein